MTLKTCNSSRRTSSTVPASLL